MAKTISDENIRLNIIINGNKAQKELFDLEKRTRNLRNTNNELRAAKTKLRLEGKKGTEEYKRLSAEITANNLTLRKNKARMSELQKEIGITGLTMAQLSKKALILRSQLKNAIPGSAAYKRYQTELKQVSGRLTELNGKAKLTKLSLSSLAQGFNKYFALGASAIAVGTGMVLSLQKMIDYNGKLSDAQADVMKTTGMTKKEVDELTKSYGLFKTRTARIDLLKISEIGGRIGIAKKDIAAFTVEMNKANVALGDTFTGGAEEVATKLGKLKTLFRETKDIDVSLAYNAIGSAINQLGASGKATEIEITDFATGVGSLPDVMKPSINEALGLGAAFAESGIQANKSGRAYGIFIRKAATSTGKFAKVMGISKKEVENLINTNPTEFFLQFSEGLKGMDATETAKTLKFLGLNADGVNKIVGSAANNIDRFRQLLDISNKSMIEGTSVMNEYNIKNNNLAATLSKVKKHMLGLFTSITISKGLNNFLIWFGKLIGAVDDVDGKTTVWRNRLIALIKTMLIITTAMVSYKTAVRLATLWTERATVGTASYNLIQKVTAITTGILTKATLLGKAAVALFTGNITRARAAMKLFNLTTKLNPIGLIVGAITAATVAYIAFANASNKATASQSALNSLNAKTASNLADIKSELKILTATARDENIAKEARLEAIKKINKISPEYLSNITLENINTLKTKDAINKYVIAMKQKIEAQVAENLFKEKQKELDVAEAALLKEKTNKTISWEKIFLGIYGRTNATKIQQRIDAIKKEKEATFNLWKERLKASQVTTTGGSNAPQEGDVKTEGGVTYIYRSGKWVKKETNSVTPTLTPEDQAILDSKKKLAEFLNQFEKDQELQKELQKFDKEQRNQQEEILKTEAKYQKMATDAGFETTLAAGLEDAKNAAIDKIRKKWAAKRLKDKVANDKKLAKNEQKFKRNRIKAERDLEIALHNARTQGLFLLKGILGRKSTLYKIIFGLEKALAINEIITSTTKSIALSRAANAAVPFVLPPGIPNPMKPISIATMKASVLSSKINAATQIATIVGTVLKGYQDGLYPVQRQQDGKIFNAVYGGQVTSGLVSKPTVFNAGRNQFLAGEQGASMPEMIIDGAAYKKMNPQIKYALQREIARVKGFEVGLYPKQTIQQNFTQTSTQNLEDNNNNELLIAALNRNSEVLEKLEESGVIAYMSRDLRNAKLIRDDIKAYETLRNKNKIN